MKEKGLRLLSLLLVAVLLIAGTLPGLAPEKAKAAGTVYYVDSASGNDANAGTSEGSPWKTLNKINATTFLPGDTILFKAGSAWTGTLNPKGSGSEGNPIRIDRYGDGPKPLIAGKGASAAVYFYSQEQWEVRNLEITNYASTPGQRRGIHVAGNSGGWNNPKVYKHFIFENLEIHSVTGSLANDYAHNGGIIVWDETWNYIVTDVTIRNNKIYSMDSVGIYLNGGSKPFSFSNKVQDNVIYDIGGDGAYILNTNNGVIERNVVYDTHKRSTSYHVPLWVFESKDSVIQYNEVFNTYPGGDAMAYDSDYKSEGTIIQYNYSHDNAGGMSLAVNDGTQAGTYNRNTIIRYNISQNDLGAVFNYSGTPENTHVYNNTVYIPPGSTTKVVDTLNWGGWAKNTTYTNNIIVNLGTGDYNFGSSTNNVFDNNLFYGNHPQGVLNLDANKIVADPLLAAPGTGRIGRDTLGGYQLLSGSPAIGAGKIMANNGGQDFFGNPVPADSKPNIGAYEGAGLQPGELPPGAEVTNLLENPGFEEGNFTGWGNTYGDATVTDTGARTGTHAATLAGAVSGIERTVTVKPNTIYKLSGYAIATSGGSAVIGVKNYGGTAKDVSTGSAAYTAKEVTFTTGSSNTTAIIYMYKQGAAGTVTFDDLLLYEFGQVQPPAVPPAITEPSPGKQNLAPLAALTASSSHASGAYPPSKAVDGVKSNPDSRWIALGGTNPPHWLEMDWSQSYEIDRVRVWSGAGTGANGWQIRDFQVQYWDGAAWQTAAQVTGNTKDGLLGQFNDLTFPKVTTSKLRIYITKGTDNGTTTDKLARVFEIEVWEHDPNPAVIEKEPVYVYAIDVLPKDRITAIDAGGTQQMLATVKPDNAEQRVIAWSVTGTDGQPTALAAIDSSGLLTASGPGKVKVTAAATDGSGVNGDFTITVAPPLLGTNIAPLAAATASSSHESGEFPPERTINGIKHDIKDRWVTGPEGPHWLELDWAAPYLIDHVRLWSGQIDGMGMQIVDFELQAWNGSSWDTVKTVTGNTKDNYWGEYSDLSFAPVHTDRLRLYITKGNPIYDERARLFEMEVYGQPYSGPSEDPILPEVRLGGTGAVFAGEPVTTSVSVTASTYEYNIVDAIIQFDPAVLEYAVTPNVYGEHELDRSAIVPVHSGLQVLGTAIKQTEGLIRVILSSTNGSLSAGGELLQLMGRVKAQAPAGPVALAVTAFTAAGPGNISFAADTAGVVQTVTVVTADRTQLGQTIASARNLHDSAVEGTAAGQYPSGAKAALLAAIQTASAVYQQPTATQQQINDALAALNTAVAAFSASMNVDSPANKEVLRSAVTKAEELYNKSVAGTKIGQYPLAAKTALLDAINSAKNILNNSAGQSTIDTAVTTLNDKAEQFKRLRINLIPGESEITIKTLSLMAQYFGVQSTDSRWSEIEAADMLDQQEITIQSLAAVAQLILSEWLND